MLSRERLRQIQALQLRKKAIKERLQETESPKEKDSSILGLFAKDSKENG
jgi:hypothetical protein